MKVWQLCPCALCWYAVFALCCPRPKAHWAWFTHIHLELFLPCAKNEFACKITAAFMKRGFCFVLTIMSKSELHKAVSSKQPHTVHGHYLHTARSTFPLEGDAFTSKWSGGSSGDVVREKPSHLRQETRKQFNNSVWGPRTKQQVSTGVIWKWINTYTMS